MDTAQPKSELLTAAELASVLRIGQETVRQLAKSGAIPCLRVGRTFRFDLEEVLRTAARLPHGRREERD